MRALNTRFLIPLTILILFCIVVVGYTALVPIEDIYTQNPNATIALRGKATLRDSAILTTSYVDTSVVRLAPFSNICMCFDVNKGSLTSFEYKVLQSYDGYTWFTEAAEQISTTVITDYIIYYQRTLSSTNEKWYKIISFYGNYLKLQVKGTGTTTGSSCAVYVLGSQN